MPLDLDTVIVNLRGFRVILDLDLALLYGVSPKRLNEQVKRNRGRFPEDFMFQLEDQEFSILRSQIATAKWNMRRTNPYAFTAVKGAKSFAFICYRLSSILLAWQKNC
jgi:hypothetical protein